MTCQAGFAGDSQVLYSMGSYGDVNVGQTAFDAAINWADDVIVRECSDCAESHALIYYKRLTPIRLHFILQLVSRHLGECK